MQVKAINLPQMDEIYGKYSSHLARYGVGCPQAGPSPQGGPAWLTVARAGLRLARASLSRLRRAARSGLAEEPRPLRGWLAAERAAWRGWRPLAEDLAHWGTGREGRAAASVSRTARVG